MSEQQCYTRADLERHNTGGSHVDRDSCLGQSGFKGHPQCGFCKKRFYDDGALYTHMQQEHYTCHICQRAEPNKFVYYHDYNKLEEHFRADHCALGPSWRSLTALSARFARASRKHYQPKVQLVWHMPFHLSRMAPCPLDQ